MKPRIRLRNKSLFRAVDLEYTLWTITLPECDNEIIYMKAYDDLVSSRPYVESVISELYRAWKEALNK